MVVYYSLVYGKGSLLVREKKRFVGLMFVGRFQAIYRVEKDGLESKPIITSLVRGYMAFCGKKTDATIFF